MMELLTDIDKFREVCNLSANISELFTGKPHMSPAGIKYFDVHFKIELNFGTTELQAKITWIAPDVSI